MTLAKYQRHAFCEVVQKCETTIAVAAKKDFFNLKRFRQKETFANTRVPNVRANNMTKHSFSLLHNEVDVQYQV